MEGSHVLEDNASEAMNGISQSRLVPKSGLLKSRTTSCS